MLRPWLLPGALPRGLFRGLFRGLLGGLFRSQLSSPLGGLFRGPLGGLLISQLKLVRCLLRCQLRLEGFLRHASRFGRLLCFGRLLRLGFLVVTAVFFFNDFLHAQTRLFSALRARSREIPVLCAMQIGPGIKRGHVFRSLVLVARRFAICHLNTIGLSLPGSLPFVPAGVARPQFCERQCPACSNGVTSLVES